MAEEKSQGKNPPVVKVPVCVGCGACVAVCPIKPSVFDLIDDVSVVVHPELCIDCGMCVTICPVEAIAKEK